MKIEVLSAIAEGPTGLSAFDAALHSLNVDDFNLITLSSVIPSEATVQTASAYTGPIEIGDRLYVVLAQERARPGQQAWAGLAWACSPDGGIFLEGHGSDQATLTDELEVGLHDMMGRRARQWTDVDRVIVGGTAGRSHLAAVVLAVYEGAAWATT